MRQGTTLAEHSREQCAYRARLGPAACAGLLCMLSGTALALEPLPEKPGISGFVSVGAGLISAKSNLIAGSSTSDLGQARIDSIDSRPGSESDAVPNISFELRYTFPGSRTQLFAGTRLEDLLRFDTAVQLGVRQRFGRANLLAIGYLFSATAARVWSDPYVANQERQATDRSSKGWRLTWDRVFNSGLQLEYSKRKIEIDDELSGISFLGLGSAEAALLRREGDQETFEVLHWFPLGKKHLIGPTLRFTRFDLDGKAMSNDRDALQLSHMYRTDRVTVVSNLTWGAADYDAVNPIYGRTRRDDLIGLGVTVLDRKLLPGRGWTALIVAAAYEEDSNIAFYDSQANLLGFAALRRF